MATCPNDQHPPKPSTTYGSELLVPILLNFLSMTAARKLKTPEEILTIYFDRKRSKNPSYSLRALARDLGKSAPFVSQLFRGKRRVPFDLISSLAEVLEMDEMARRELSFSSVFHSALPESIKNDLGETFKVQSTGEFRSYEESLLTEFDLLRNWYYVAILDLVSLKQFQPNPAWIAKKLKISLYQVETALKALFAAGLLIEKDGRWVKSKHKLRFSTKASKESVRLFHRQMIEKSLSELTTKTDEISFQKRLISGMSIATNPKNLERAKNRLNEMIFELSEILSEGECTELYQFNLQLFALTNNDEGAE